MFEILSGSAIFLEVFCGILCGDSFLLLVFLIVQVEDIAMAAKNGPTSIEKTGVPTLSQTHNPFIGHFQENKETAEKKEKKESPFVVRCAPLFASLNCLSHVFLFLKCLLWFLHEDACLFAS